MKFTMGNFWAHYKAKSSFQNPKAGDEKTRNEEQREDWQAIKGGDLQHSKLEKDVTIQ